MPPQPPKKAPPKSTARAAVLEPGSGTGRPPGFRVEAPAAYWIWQGPRGGWRIRTTTAGAQHTFRGRIEGMTGPVVTVDPSRRELRERIWKTGDGWVFTFRTESHADGFVFDTRDNGCVRFDLELDGGPVPKRIFVGRREVEPTGGHFIVCPKGATPKSAR